MLIMSDTFFFCFLIFAFISVFVLDLYSFVLGLRAKKLQRHIEEQLLDIKDNDDGENKKC